MGPLVLGDWESDKGFRKQLLNGNIDVSLMLTNATY